MGWRDQIKQQVDNTMVEAVEKAARDVVAVTKKTYSTGKAGDQELSPYSRSQRSRRNRRGLQTANKDLQYSGTLLDSVKIISRNRGDGYYEVRMGVTGSAYRRSDQSSISTQRQAEYLSEQQGIPNILQLSERERRNIEQAYNVEISYD